MIFLRTSPLDNDASARIDDEDGKSAVQQAGAMHGRFCRRADGTVALVDQDQPILAPRLHGFPSRRKSFTRTALPCERGISPGALSAISQVTPAMALMCALTSPAVLARNPSSAGKLPSSSTSTVIASIGPTRVSTIW